MQKEKRTESNHTNAAINEMKKLEQVFAFRFIGILPTSTTYGHVDYIMSSSWQEEAVKEASINPS